MRAHRHAMTASVSLLVALAAVGQAQEKPWTSHGPTGAGVTFGVAVGDSVAYAATPRGVFRSRDGGATWTQTTLATGIVQVVAGHGTSVVLAVASPTLYFSPDEGDSWTVIPGVPSAVAGIDPAHPSTLYSGAYQGIWKSTDSGANWQLLSTAPTGRFGISFAFDSNAIYVLDFDESAGRYELHQSLDGGDSWASVSTPIPATAVAAGVASGLVYVGGSGSLCRSADSTATWTCSSFPKSPFLILEVPGNGSAAPRILAISDAGAYSSSDGTTWARAAAQLDSSVSVEAFASDTSGSLVLAGTNAGIFRSSDRGDTWMPASVGLRSSAITALAIDPRDPTTVWAIGNGFDGEDSGLFRSGDAGLDWSLGSGPRGSLGFGALTVDPEHSSTLCVGGSTFYRSIDGGDTWTSSPLPGGASVNSLATDPGSPEGVWAATSGGLFRRDDGSQGWRRYLAVAQEISALLLDSKRPGTMYAGSYFDEVDGGYYPGPEGGSIFVSRDSGASWTKNPKNFGSSVVAIAVDPFVDGVLYAGALDVFRSTDDGLTWQSASVGLGEPPFGVVSLLADPVRPGYLYCLTDTGGVYRSTDGAQTWQPFSSGLGAFQVNAIVISPDGRWLHAGTFGGGVFDLDLEGSYPCSPTATRLCLVGNRYAVDLVAAGPGAFGAAHSLGDRAGYFGLPGATGDPNLPEVVVKMLPQGALGSRSAPVFYASLTTIPYVLEVYDTVTGDVRSYDSDSLCGRADIPSMASEASLSPSRVSAAATSALSLLGGRFSITLEARRPGGASVTAFVMASEDRFGIFSFPGVSGDAQFPEVVVKMIDATAIDGRFWFFHSDLTSLDYTLTVEDLVTGVTRTYESGQPFCGGADTDSFMNMESPWDY